MTWLSALDHDRGTFATENTERFVIPVSTGIQYSFKAIRVADPGLVTFSCAAKEKVTKEKAAPWFPCAGAVVDTTR